MDGKITGKNLKAALGADLDGLLEGVAKTTNQARADKIIADSEEDIRDAAAWFRRRLFEKAPDLRQQQQEQPSVFPLRTTCHAAWQLRRKPLHPKAA